MKREVYNYTNNLGIPKIMYVGITDGGIVNVEVWSGQTGEMETTGMLCGFNNFATVAEFRNWLKDFQNAYPDFSGGEVTDGNHRGSLHPIREEDICL